MRLAGYFKTPVQEQVCADLVQTQTWTVSAKCNSVTLKSVRVEQLLVAEEPAHADILLLMP